MQEALFINIRSKRLLKTTSYLFSSRTVQQSVGSSLILSLGNGQQTQIRYQRLRWFKRRYSRVNWQFSWLLLQHTKFAYFLPGLIQFNTWHLSLLLPSGLIRRFSFQMYYNFYTAIWKYTGRNLFHRAFLRSRDNCSINRHVKSYSQTIG